MDFSKLKSFMDDMTEHMTPGHAIEVYLKGESVFRYESGYSDLEIKRPFSADDMLYIYSASKMTTVAAALQLLEQGKFLLEDPLYDYIPEFKQMYIKTPDGNLVEAKNPITVGDLFTMTAGFSYDFGTEGFKKAKEKTAGKMDTVETIKCIASDPICFEPGSKWQYSICHDVLAALVSVVSGQKFRDYVKEHIFTPLDMQDAVYHATEEMIRNMPTQYRFVSQNDKNVDIVEAQKSGTAKDGIFIKEGKVNTLILGEEYDSGGAGIITTVSEYAKFMAALANRGLGLTGERILSAYSIELMRTNRLTDSQRKIYDTWKQVRGCGFGLGVRTHTNPEISGSLCNIGEFGWGGAAGATAIVDPKIGLGVFYAQHCLNPREAVFQPRLRNVIYACLESV